MGNFKVKVNNEDESREVQELLFSIGRTHDDGSKDHYQFCFGKYPQFINCEDEYISASRTGYLSYDEITLPELRAMVNNQHAEVEQVRQTLNERQSQYGSFKDVADTTAALMDQFALGRMSNVQREALHMICSKLARIANGDPNHVDSWHDIAGYATLVVDDLES